MHQIDTTVKIIILNFSLLIFNNIVFVLFSLYLFIFAFKIFFLSFEIQYDIKFCFHKIFIILNQIFDLNSQTFIEIFNKDDKIHKQRALRNFKKNIPMENRKLKKENKNHEWTKINNR